MSKKEPGRVPVRQTLASYITNFQHVSIIPQQLPGRLPTKAEYQYITSSLGNIWETF